MVDLLASGHNVGETTTVQFNVGGKMYEVSRSLLERYPDTMLARMASKTWISEDKNDASNDGDKTCGNGIDDVVQKGRALFIEHNGDRFQYCLDFMRDGGIVNLPANVSKEAFLLVLIYFGFDDFDPSRIFVIGSAIMYKTCLEHLKSHVKDLEKTKRCLDLAKYCISTYMTSTSLVYHDIPSSHSGSLKDLANHGPHRKHFNQFLEKSRLQFKSLDGSTLCLDHL